MSFETVQILETMKPFFWMLALDFLELQLFSSIDPGGKFVAQAVDSSQPTHFRFKQRNFGYVKIAVEVFNLLQIFLLEAEIEN